jgi:cytochrome c553
MKGFRPSWIRGLLFALAVASARAVSGAVDFEKEVRPLLIERCASCHGEKKQKALLRLDRRADAFKGGENGVVIVAGKPEASPLFQRVMSTDADEVMPPKGERLSERESATLRQWIAEGAAWPDDGSVADTFALAKGHWAFTPPRKAIVPAGEHPVDFFIGVKHRELGLKPAPEADQRTLLRRVTIDLTGLPPSVEDATAFLSVTNSTYDALVDRLLASPQYGERWGRFWLDLARWAESDGYEANDLRASAWRYRDYVVKAFNDDRPYDVFLREQIAGDELSPYSDEHLIATGFLAAARNNNNEEDKAVQLNEPLVDIANTTASVALGLTLACAQCHDHKFEALTLRDYYAWHGLFVRGQVNGLLLRDDPGNAAWERSQPPELDTARQLLKQLTDPVRARLRVEAEAKLSGGQRAALQVEKPSRTPEQNELAKAAEKALAISDTAVKQALADEDKPLDEALRKKIAALEKQRNDQRPHTWGFYSPATSPHDVKHLPPRGQYPFSYNPAALKDTTPAVLKRGIASQRGEPVTTAVPAVLGGAKVSTRRELAGWLASDANPLTARVWANFVWQQHFGRGLVETPGDFGVKGARPANQALLDWLACELREHGWSTKHLHRLIVTSAAYRRASQSDAANLEHDRENVHLWRWLPLRLEAEAIRDSLLAVAGRLDLTAGGPSDPPDKPSFRRSLYQLQQRFKLPPGQALFDAPTANESCPRRHVSTVPLQPLLLLNNEANVKLAADFSTRVRQVAGDDTGKQIATAFRLALGREPDDMERGEAEKFLARPDSSGSVLTDFCQAVMNLNEFVYVP